MAPTQSKRKPCEVGALNIKSCRQRKKKAGERLQELCQILKLLDLRFDWSIPLTLIVSVFSSHFCTARHPKVSVIARLLVVGECAGRVVFALQLAP